MNKTARGIFFVLPLMILGNVMRNGEIPQSRPSAVHEYLKRMEAFGFSGVVLVEQEGRVLVKQGFGLADLEGEIPFTTHTGFFVASLSKQFTASMILALAERELIELNASVSRYVSGKLPLLASVFRSILDKPLCCFLCSLDSSDSAVLWLPSFSCRLPVMILSFDITLDNFFQSVNRAQGEVVNVSIETYVPHPRKTRATQTNPFMPGSRICD